MSGPRRFERLLVTGGAGFIGSCYVRDVLGRRDGTRITVLDKLTYAGNEANLAGVRADPEMDQRLTFVHGDIAEATLVRPLVASVDAVVNFAAESHVDRSILDPEAFLATGVIGVHVLLDACRDAPDRPRFLQVSTDEVYGSVADGHAREDAAMAPRSPYAAAKAAGELLVRSYVITHGIDAVVTRGANTYGPYHHPEKLIPLFITNAIDDLPLPLYGDGLQRRDWLYVSDHAGAVDFVLRQGASGETYNVVGGSERANREVVAALLDRLGKPWSLVREVEDRPGHDRRYAMEGAKLTALGWRPLTTFDDGLASTIDWYRANEAWWRATRSGDWDGWYERQYGRRLANGRATAATAVGMDASVAADATPNVRSAGSGA
jgi:dTDP-glucose 4,6-dehydratase